MSCSRRSTAKSCYLDRSGDNWGVYSVSSPGARNARSRKGAGLVQITQAPDARPCTHADFDSTEIFGGGGDRVSEGEELDLDCAEHRTQAAQFFEPQILGEGLLRFDSGAG